MFFFFNNRMIPPPPPSSFSPQIGRIPPPPIRLPLLLVSLILPPETPPQCHLSSIFEVRRRRVSCTFFFSSLPFWEILRPFLYRLPLPFTDDESPASRLSVKVTTPFLLNLFPAPPLSNNPRSLFFSTCCLSSFPPTVPPTPPPSEHPPVCPQRRRFPPLPLSAACSFQFPGDGSLFSPVC